MKNVLTLCEYVNIWCLHKIQHCFTVFTVLTGKVFPKNCHIRSVLFEPFLISPHKELLDTLEKDPDEIRRHLSEALRKLTVLRVNEKKLTRRYITLLEQEQHLRKENNKLKDESSHMQASVTQRLGYLQRYKVQKIQFHQQIVLHDLNGKTPDTLLSPKGFCFTFVWINGDKLVYFSRENISQCLNIKQQHKETRKICSRRIDT